MSNIYNKYPWIIIIIITCMSLISIGMIHYSFKLGHEMTAKHSVLVDAAMEAKYEITLAHLWTEELIEGDQSVTGSQIKKSIDEAKWYLKAMLFGGQNDEGLFFPIEDCCPRMKINIQEALKLIENLQIASYNRVTHKESSGVGSVSDIKYDALFNEIIVKIDLVETNLQKLIANDLDHYEWMKNLLVIFVLLTNSFILLFYKTILKFQKTWFLKYFKVENEKDKLKRLYKEIRDAQAIIDKYVPMSKTDIQGNIIDVNEAMCDLCGYTKEELIGKNHRILRFPNEKAEKYKEMWKEISHGGIWEGEVKNVDKCGETYWVNAHIHPIIDENKKQVGYQALRENITNRKELEFLSSHDRLTNIYNRGKFDSLLEYELEQFSRYNKIFSLAMLDLDHFKNVNDTFGHQVGDDVLIRFVQIVKTLVRDSDVFARWGGEEFVLLLPHTNKGEAKIVIEKIRKTIDEYIFETVGNVTFSAGVSESIKNDTLSSFVKRIDDALYEAKDSGRNKIVIG